MALVKPVLEGILIYLHLSAHIPNGVLEKIRRLLYDFLWRGNSDNVGFHLARWQLLAKPKHEGGWGLKQIYLFGKSLAAMSSWNLISKDRLWKRNIVQKYLVPDTLLDWIRNPNKSIRNASN